MDPRFQRGNFPVGTPPPHNVDTPHGPVSSNTHTHTHTHTQTHTQTPLISHGA